MNDSNDTDMQCKIKTDINIKIGISVKYLNQISKLGSIGQQVYLYFKKKWSFNSKI